MKCVTKAPKQTLRHQVGCRWFSSSPLQLSAEAMTVRSKGYGPTKDLLRGVDTTKKIVLETSLHPMDAEMQRRVLSLSSSDVSVITPLDEATTTMNKTVQEGGRDARLEPIIAVAPDQLASIATVIVDQVREELKLSGCTAEAMQDGRAASVVNAVASCLREEIERLLLATHTQEASFSNMLQENANVICARVVDVIRAERSSPSTKEGSAEPQRLSHLVEGVASTLANLELSLKALLEANLASAKEVEPVPDDLREHVVAAIEQASSLHQERLAVFLGDLLAKSLPTETSLSHPSSIKAVEEVVKGAMMRVVEDTQREVRDMLQVLRSDNSASARTVPSSSEKALEGLLASYGERLEQMREATTGFSDIRELLMEVHSQQQMSVNEMNEVKASIKKLKKELMSALQDVGSGNSLADTKNESAFQLDEYREKLNALTDQVVSTVEQQLREQYADVKGLTDRLLELETVIRENQKPAIQHVTPPLQDFDDDRMVDLAQSISASIIASLPPREVTPSEVAPPVSRFTSADIELLAGTVAKVLGPKLDELSTTVQATQTFKNAPLQTEGNLPLIGEEQIITLTQTITDGVRDALRDTISLQQQQLPPQQQMGEGLESREENGALLGRLDALKENIIAAVREEMGYVQEIDLTPLQSYLDGVIGGLQKALENQQELTQGKIDGVVEAIAGRLEQQQEQLTQFNKSLSGEVKGVISGEVIRVLSSLKTVHEEVRVAAQESPVALEKKLASIELLLRDALSAEQERSLRAQAVLEGVSKSIKSVTDEKETINQILASINDAVAQVARQNATSASEMKTQLSATDARTDALHAQMTTQLSKHFGELQTELLSATRRIDELVSSSAEYNNVASAVESMRVKLDEVGRSLNSLALQDELQKHRDEKPNQHLSLESLESKLSTLFGTTQEILSVLQEYRPSAEASPPTTQTPSLNPSSAATRENLEAMEGRLREQLLAFQMALDGLTQIGSDTTSAAFEESSERLDSVTDKMNRQIGEIDSLMKLVQATQGVQTNEMQEILVALRSFLAGADREGAGAHHTEQLLEALETNRLKVVEDVTASEAELVRLVNEKIQQIMAPFSKSMERAIFSSSEAQVQQLHANLDAISTRLDAHQDQLASQLHDKIDELGKFHEGKSAEITTEIRKGQKEWRETLERLMQQDMPATIKGCVVEACTDQLHSVFSALNEQKAAEKKSTAALLSSVQQLSHDVGQLGTLGGELRTAVTQGSTEMLKELRRAHEGLTGRFDERLSVAMATREPPAVSGVMPAFSQMIRPNETTVVQTGELSIWWLLALSLAVLVSIMLCAYFLFAAFLVAFVPVPPPKELLLSAEQLPEGAARTPKKLSSRVVDQVVA